MQIVSKVAKSMRKVPAEVKADDPVQVGRWQLNVRKSSALFASCFNDLPAFGSSDRAWTPLAASLNSWVAK